MSPNQAYVKSEATHSMSYTLLEFRSGLEFQIK